MKKIAVIAPLNSGWREFENTLECDRLFEQIQDLLKETSGEKGEVCLISSVNIGAETLAATAALSLKPEHNVFLECVIPFEEQAAEWSEPDRDRYFDILERCDSQILINTRFSKETEYNCIKYILNSADEIVTVGELPLKTGVMISESGKKVIKF